MPSLLYYLRRTREQSLRETVNLAQQVVADRVRTVIQPSYDRLFHSAPGKEQILKRSGAAGWGELAARLKQRSAPALFDLPRVTGSAESLIGLPLEWHADEGSGYKWDSRTHYRQIPLAPEPGVDIKNPWDRSRFHAAMVLAQAYRDTSQEKYAEEFARRVLDWIEQNPFRHGVNWTSAMEAGIRAVNWTCAFYLMRSARTLDEHFVPEFLCSLSAHAEFIKSNLEYREAWIGGKRHRLNSNHYLCDLAGLLFIAVLFPELKLDGDRQLAAAELERELFEETHSDGVDYEHSTTYHRFVLEIFTACFSLLRCNGHAVSSSVDHRLSQMKRFLSACAHPDGTFTQIGDNDGGMLMPLSLVSVAPDAASAGFPEGGVYCMRGVRGVRGDDSHVVVSAARVGMRGFGSHSHNDILSFEYWWAGQAWIVDPGTYVYLPDPQARNWFRSTEAHNTVRVDRAEINPFHEESVFQMLDAAEVKIERWDAGATIDSLVAAHTGYSRLPGKVRHRRRFTFEKTAARLEIEDVLEGDGEHSLEWFFQVHPAVAVQGDGGEFLLSAGNRRLKVRIHDSSLTIDRDKTWYSPTYGAREPATRLTARVQTRLPRTVTTVIEPC